MPKISSHGRVLQYQAFFHGFVGVFLGVLEESRPWCESRILPVGPAPVTVDLGSFLIYNASDVKHTENKKALEGAIQTSTK